MTVREVEKRCPLCGEVGPAMSEDGETVLAYKCKNNDCDKDFFISSEMSFYPPHNNGWTWDSITEVES